jgi:hypothetical protein
MDMNELADKLDGMASSTFFGPDKDVLRQAAAALRESEGWRRDAERWRMFLRCLHNGHIPGAGHGHRIRLVKECPLFGDESEVSNVETLIDAARKEGVQK